MADRKVVSPRQLRVQGLGEGVLMNSKNLRQECNDNSRLDTGRRKITEVVW